VKVLLKLELKELAGGVGDGLEEKEKCSKVPEFLVSKSQRI
jgi:hypothetical protein